MRWLELKIPPLLVFIGGLALVLLAGWLFPGWRLPAWPPLHWLYWALMALAAGILGLSQWQFYRGKTTVNPMDPGAATCLLQNGVFALSRNPVYLAMALVLLAVALRQGPLAGLLIPVMFVVYLTRWQIRPEEHHLRQRFGETYEHYCRRVRRWL